LWELQERHNALWKDACQLKALVSPARRLYPEVVAIIFEHCLAHDTEPLNSYRRKIQVSPLRLSQICSGWRELALSMPQLWSSIRITFDPSLLNYVEIVQKRAKMLRTWLERSGSLPITVDIRRCDSESLYLRQSNDVNSKWETEGGQLVAELLPYSNRWTDLTFYLPNACLFPLWNAMDYRLPQLAALTIINGDADRQSMPSGSQIPLLAIKNIPDIRRLSLSQPLLDLPSYDVPWSRLSYLSLMVGYSCTESSLSVNSAASVLRNCTNIVECHLNIGSSGTILGGPVKVPRLKILHLEVRGYSALHKKLESPWEKLCLYLPNMSTKIIEL
jgi:hypothetical protein